MQRVRTFGAWRQQSLAYFEWRITRSAAVMAALSLGMAAVTGLAAQIRIPLPNTPVPVTGQVLAVLLSGMLLGSRYGALSQILYVSLGWAGVPWFSGWQAGFVAVTGGYLIGFVPAAYLVGALSDRHVRARDLFPQIGIMATATLIIYLCGALQFALVMGTSLRETFAMAVWPFVGPDLVKAAVAAGIASAFLPRMEYRRG